LVLVEKVVRQAVVMRSLVGLHILELLLLITLLLLAAVGVELVIMVFARRIQAVVVVELAVQVISPLLLDRPQKVGNLTQAVMVLNQQL
jgi:hypothetical protein